MTSFAVESRGNDEHRDIQREVTRSPQASGSSCSIRWNVERKERHWIPAFAGMTNIDIKEK
jgi:hypothetical protein